MVEQVRADPSAAPVSAKLKVLLQIAAAVRDNGHAVTAGHIADAGATGATDVEVHDTILIAAMFCMVNRYVDGLATIAPTDPAQYAAGAQRLIAHGYLPPQADPRRPRLTHAAACLGLTSNDEHSLIKGDACQQNLNSEQLTAQGRFNIHPPPTTRSLAH